MHWHINVTVYRLYGICIDVFVEFLYDIWYLLFYALESGFP